MPADKPAGDDTGPRRCPVCWRWFTPNSASNPHPRRYCCGACRIEDSRRRREREQTQLLLDAKLGILRTARYAEDERRETTRLQYQLEERRKPMNPA
ncbi:MAG: hypothetical protein H0U35_11475 [Sporichthyaceae bacterium]|nr:hypothetical protein [Sporichthyaceae bacterium]